MGVYSRHQLLSVLSHRAVKIQEFMIPIQSQGCKPRGCFTNVLRALQYILSTFVYCRNCTSYKNFKTKLGTCAQSHTKFQLEILTINVISGFVYFREIILESSQSISETTPWGLYGGETTYEGKFPVRGMLVGMNVSKAEMNLHVETRDKCNKKKYCNRVMMSLSSCYSRSEICLSSEWRPQFPICGLWWLWCSSV